MLNYVVTGATGHTGKIVAEALLKAGKPTVVVGRSAEKLKELVALGAIPAVGDLDDVAFLEKTFHHAKAAYLMIPPNFAATDGRAYYVKIATHFALALSHAKVKHAVYLSSYGAHLPEGAGPVSGAYYAEQILNAVPGLNVLHLRPPYFMENLYNNIGMIKHGGILGTSIAPDFKFFMIHTRDIADIAAQRLLSLDFHGSSVELLTGDGEHSHTEILGHIRKATGKADLPYVHFTPEQEYQGMLQAGLPKPFADGLRDMYVAFQTPAWTAGADHSTANAAPTSLQSFIENEWIHAFNAGATGSH